MWQAAARIKNPNVKDGSYSLKQDLEDGFLAPYKGVRIATDVDAVGYTPKKGKVDKLGQAVEQRQYNTKDFDCTLVLDKHTKLVASKVWECLRATDPRPRLSFLVMTRITRSACYKNCPS